MKIRRCAWPQTPSEAIGLQKVMKEKIILKYRGGQIKLVAGCDVSYRGKETTVASIVVMRYSDLGLVEEVTRVCKGKPFPYIPGLFSFREIPPLLLAIEEIKSEPDVFLFDGHGIAHPRRMGLATHAGILIDRPAIGCAKSRLYGQYDKVPVHKGDYTFLKDRKGDVIGACVRTRKNVKPIFVSPGHRIDLEYAIEVVLHCTRRYKMPEPLRRAHFHTQRDLDKISRSAL